MKGMSKFQLILTGIFGAFILIGVLVFAFGQSSKSKNIATATIWGTMSSGMFESFLKEAGLDQDKTVKITYIEKRKDAFDQEFLEALAVGKGPDLFFLSQDGVLKHQDKIIPIPFTAFPERDFKNSFIEEGELFIFGDGFLGLPFLIDPMVMYWNRDIFSNAGLSVPPKYWSEIYGLSASLTKKDANLNINKSVIAFGEYGNITNASEILGLLVMQAGNPITARRPEDGAVYNLFNQRLENTVSPAVSALNFYTEFANPLKPFYSWNRALPESKDFFLSGDLALYFGFASELSDIRLKNPNLNFAVAPVLQSKSSERIVTFGRMAVLAIAKNSANVASAYQVAYKLTNTQSILALAKVTNLPPVRRELLASRPPEAFLSVFYDGAIQARGWLSPEPARLGLIFKEMIESVTAGRAGTAQAVSKAHEQLDAVLKRP